MSQWNLKEFRLKHLDSILAGIIGFFIVYISTAHEKIVISTDSIIYTHAAKEMYYHHVFTEFNGHPLVDFPFFYPFILALFIAFTHYDPIVFSPFFNGFLFALVVFLAGLIIENINPSKKVYKWLLLAIILSSPSLHQVYFALWSETLFIAEVLLFIITIHSYQKQYSVKSLFALIVITAISCITRYASIVLIGCGCLLLLMNKKIIWRKKLVHGLLFIIGSSSLLVANMIRNHIVSGTVTGPRQKGTTAFKDNISTYGNVISKWIPFVKQHSFLSITLAIIILTSLAIIITWKYRRTQTSDYITILSSFVLIYSCFFILVSTLLKFEQIDNRFLSPLFIPLLIISTCWAPTLVHRISGVNRKWVAAGLLILFTILFIFQLKNDQSIAKSYSNSNIPLYSDSVWKKSEIANYIKQHRNIFDPHYSIYSNASEAAYFFGGLSGDRLPQKINKQEINDFLDQDSVYVIWFNRIKSSDEISDTFILNNKEMKPIQKLADGTIYVSVDEED